MRTGWNPRLAALLQRPDPAARLIPEAVVTSAEDVRRRRDEWETGAVTGDVQTLPSGGVRLTGQVREYVSQTTRGDWITDLDPAGALHVARLRWPGARYAESEITRIRVWLHPRLDGGLDQEVAYWECRVWSLMRYRVRTGGLIYVSIAPAAAPVRVVAGGAEGEVTFAFDGLAPAGQTPIFEEGAELVPGPIYPDPVTYISVAALKSDGSPAGNVGWAIDPNKTDPITSNPAVTLDGWTLTEVGDSPTDPELAGWWRDDSGVDPVPYIIVERGDLAPATVEFSGAAQIDLGAPPAADELVEFVAQGETPSDSDLVFEVLDDAGTTWVPVRDGQTVDELPGVSARQTYAMRVTLTPNGEGDVSPVARDLGVRTVRRWTLTGLADVHIATTWGFDPRTFVGSIPDGRVTILRDGSRDYRDFATELLSQHPAADIAVRLWVGSERLPRSDWLLIDVWELEAYDPQPGAIHLDCISPAARLRTARIPVIDEVRGVREPLVYTNDSLADVYADLIAGQIALPERFRGAGVSDDVTLVGNTIEDSEGKTELDAISYLAGGTTIASQGLVKFVDIVGAAGIRAVFPAEEIEVVGATPGLRQAVPEWIVPWDWSEEEGRFRGEVPVHHIPALEAVRQGRLDAPGSLAPEIARWIASEDHAKAIGTRHVSWFGTGLIQIHLRAEYPHPYLEPGDLVLVELRDLVARDPNTARALKGQLWALAVVNEVADSLGRELYAWVRSYADLIPTAEAAERIGDVRPEVISVDPVVDSSGHVDVAVYGNTATGYLRAAASKVGFPDATTVDASPAIPGRVVTFDDLVQLLSPAETAFISVRAYERADGQGAASALVQVTARQPGFAAYPSAQLASEGAVGVAEYRYRVTGANVDGSTGGLEYRFVTHLANEPQPAWPASWQPLPSGGATFDVTQNVRHTTRIGVQVRDAQQRMAPEQWASLAPILPGISDGGNPKWGSVEDDDGTKPEDGATRGAPSGTPIGGGTFAELVEDGAARARTGLDGAGFVALDVPLVRAVAHVPAISTATGRIDVTQPYDGSSRTPADTDADAQSKGQNLLPASAWPEQSFTGTFDRWFNPDGLSFDSSPIALDDMGLAPGDAVVLSGRVKSNAGGRVALQTQFYDAADAVVGSILTADVTATAYTSVSATGTVPSNAVTCATRAINRDSATNTVFSKQVTLNRGTVPLVEPPPFRVPRGERLPSQIHLPQINTANQNSAVRRLIVSGPVLNSFYNSTFNTSSIVIHPFEVVYGFGAVPYDDATIDDLSPGVTYHVYCDDPDYAGGAQSYVATTNPYEVLQGTGRVYVGSIVTADSSSGSTDGTGGGGCIAVGSWMRDGLRVEHVRPGTPIDCWVEGTDGDVQRVPVGIAAPPKPVPCVRLTSDRGAALVVGWDTPITRRDGTSVPARYADGVECLVDVGGALAWERISVEPAGVQDVILLSVGGGVFAAGERPDARIYTHNVLPVK